MVMPEPTQQAYLKAAKETLGVRWDDLATMSGIHPRALKTYRLPDESKGSRLMPSLAKEAIERLLVNHRGKS